MANGLNLQELRSFLDVEAQAGRGDVTSPGGQATFGGPFRRDLTIELDPTRQAAFDAQGRTARSLSTAGERLSARIRNDTLRPGGGGDRLSFGGLPGVGGIQARNLSFGGLPGVGGLQTQDLESRLTGGVGEGGRRRVEDAIFQRGINLLQPGQQEETRQAREDLAARGLPEGDVQGRRTLDDLARRQGFNREQLALSAVEGGGREQSRQFADLLAGSQFGLAGRGAAGQQDLQRRALFGGERAQAAGFNLAGQQAAGQQDLQRRALLGGERVQAAGFNDPLQQLAQIMGLSGFQTPIVPQPQGLSFSSAVSGSRPNNVGAFEQGGLGRDLLVGGLSGFGQIAAGAASAGSSFFDLFG